MNGYSLRVPTPDVSIVDLTAILGKDVTKAEINAAMKKAAEGELKGILQYTEDPIVSTDVLHSTYSSVFDADLTMVLGEKGNFVKVFAWYDNEWGFSNRMVDFIEMVGKKAGFKQQTSLNPSNLSFFKKIKSEEVINMAKYKTLDDFDVKNKVVFVRVDFNSEIDPQTKKVTSDVRIKAHAESTLKELAEKGAKTVVLAHQGRKGDPDYTPLKEHAAILAENSQVPSKIC